MVSRSGYPVNNVMHNVMNNVIRVIFNLMYSLGVQAHIISTYYFQTIQYIVVCQPSHLCFKIKTRRRSISCNIDMTLSHSSLCFSDIVNPTTTQSLISSYFRKEHQHRRSAQTTCSGGQEWRTLVVTGDHHQVTHSLSFRNS